MREKGAKKLKIKIKNSKKNILVGTSEKKNCKNSKNGGEIQI